MSFLSACCKGFRQCGPKFCVQHSCQHIEKQRALAVHVVRRQYAFRHRSSTDNQDHQEHQTVLGHNDKPVKPLALEFLQNIELATTSNESTDSGEESIEQIQREIRELRKMKEKLALDLVRYQNKVKQDMIPFDDVDNTVEDGEPGVNLEEMMEENKTKKLEELIEKNKKKIPNVSTTPCGGCGVLLHCTDEKIAGYAPERLYYVHRHEELLCQRCVMVNQNPSRKITAEIDMSVYQSIFKRIKMEKALIVLIVDVTDMPNSMIPDLLENVGKKTPLVIVGNKIDLIPKDGHGHHNRILARLEDECRQAGLYDGNSVKHTCLVSAKTGYGIEQLINKLLHHWRDDGMSL